MQAETISILNSNPNAKIFLNNIQIGSGSINNFELDPSEYNISVKIDEEIIFNKTIQVFSGENRVINTDQFVTQAKSNVANVGARKVEEKRLKKSVKGKIAVGLKFNSVLSGVSFKWVPIEKYALQFVGWTSSTSSESYNAYQARFIYEIDDKLVFTDTLFTLYSGIGIGKTSDELDESSLTSFLGTDNQNLTQSLFELFMGVEFPVFNISSYGYVEFGFQQNTQTNTLFNDSSSKEVLKGISFTSGIHLYFD